MGVIGGQNGNSCLSPARVRADDHSEAEQQRADGKELGVWQSQIESAPTVSRVPMEARDVLDVLTVLREAQIGRSWIDGGWGIDALLGAQHRDHDDLDLVVSVDELARVI